MEINGKYFLDDPESGRMYEVSKEHYDWYYKQWDDFMVKIKGMIDVAKERKGTILITSTPADDERHSTDGGFKKLWEQK